MLGVYSKGMIKMILNLCSWNTDVEHGHKSLQDDRINEILYLQNEEALYFSGKEEGALA